MRIDETVPMLKGYWRREMILAGHMERVTGGVLYAIDVGVATCEASGHRASPSMSTRDAMRWGRAAREVGTKRSGIRPSRLRRGPGRLLQPMAPRPECARFV